VLIRVQIRVFRGVYWVLGFIGVFIFFLLERAVGKLVVWFSSSAKLWFRFTSTLDYLKICKCITCWSLEAVNTKKYLVITGMTNWNWIKFGACFLLVFSTVPPPQNGGFFRLLPGVWSLVLLLQLKFVWCILPLTEMFQSSSDSADSNVLLYVLVGLAILLAIIFLVIFLLYCRTCKTNKEQELDGLVSSKVTPEEYEVFVCYRCFISLWHFPLFHLRHKKFSQIIWNARLADIL